MSGVMIGGCGSSGSTLLAHLLNCSSTVFCGPELNLLNKRLLYSCEFDYSEQSFAGLLENGIATTGQLDSDLLAQSTNSRPASTRLFLNELESYGYTPESAARLAAESASFIGFVEAFFAKPLELTSKRVWAEKTPENCYTIRQYLSAYENGRYVQIVRDGRDVAFSLIKRGFSPEAAVRRWIHDTAQVLFCENNSRCFVVKYEELTAEPERVLKSLFSFIGVDEDAAQIIESAEKGDADRGLKQWGLQPGSPISDSAVGKWKAAPAGQIKYLQQLFRFTTLNSDVAGTLGITGVCSGNDLLERMGYDISGEWNPAVQPGTRLYMHLMKERILAAVRPRLLYCDLNLREGRK